MNIAQNLATLLAAYGITGAPEGLEPLFEQYAAEWQPRPLLRREFLAELCRRFAPGEAGETRLFAALDEIEADERLLLLSCFLVEDMCGARHRLDLDDYHALAPQNGMQHADLYSFLLLLACVEPSMQRLAQRGVPKARYEAIPFIPAEKQMNKLRDTGDGSVADFPWDMNFYTASIFRIGRFYFIPFRMYDDLTVYRKGNETVAFFTGPVKVRRDGQLDGVNGQCDPEAFEAAPAAENGRLTGKPILPAGVVANTPRTLDLAEWTPALKKGDILLGFHIPGGPGYDPEHLRDNSVEAYEFYREYFPEIDVKGIGSESWLYDPHLAHLLGGRGNIPAMQRQMYVYPIESGDGMMWHELYGGKKPLGEVERRTSLQRAVAEYMEGGGRLTACSFFILAQDLPRVGSNPYASPESYAAVWAQMDKVWPFTTCPEAPEDGQ